jgi:FKBP-type peptidyl-prolyl cis-trans isomerase FkpA
MSSPRRPFLRLRSVAPCLLAGLIAGAAIAQAPPATPQAPAALTAEEEKQALYALGVMMWRNLQGFDLTDAEVETVQRGLADAAAGEAPELDLEKVGPQIESLRRARIAKQAEAEKARGRAYIDEQAARPGAVRGESGWVYLESAAGEGDSPTAADTVKVHYRGALIDGTEFDSSYKREQPAEFPLGRVVPCWTQALQLMKPGGKATLVCPSDTAYGDRGRPSIPPGATLVFEVELLEVQKAPAPPAAEPKPAE